MRNSSALSEHLRSYRTPTLQLRGWLASEERLGWKISNANDFCLTHRSSQKYQSMPSRQMPDADNIVSLPF